MDALQENSAPRLAGVPAASVIVDLPVEAIRVDGSTQARVQTNDAVVTDYAEALEHGAELPPVIVFDDGEYVWLADGFHRLGAHRQAKWPTIRCELHLGSLSDAVLFAAGANGDHGLRRTNQDKRRAATVLLTHPEWSKWSDSQIARHCKVSSNFVGDVRRSIFNPINDAPAPQVRSVTRNGVTYEQNTANIGKPAASAVAAAASVAPTTPSISPITSEAAAAAPSTATPRAEAPQPSSAEIITPTVSEEAAASPKMIEVDEDEYFELIQNFEKTLADYIEMARVVEANDQLKAAMEESKRHKASAESAKQSLDSKMGENNELIRTVKSLRRQLERETKRAEAAERQLAEVRAAA
jgi:hypothetical protein